jgi:hypothetical protein
MEAGGESVDGSDPVALCEQAVSGETPDSDSDEERQDEEEEEESAQAGPSTGNAQPGDQRATGSDPG